MDRHFDPFRFITALSDLLDSILERIAPIPRAMDWTALQVGCRAILSIPEGHALSSKSPFILLKSLSQMESFWKHSKTIFRTSESFDTKSAPFLHSKKAKWFPDGFVYELIETLFVRGTIRRPFLSFATFRRFQNPIEVYFLLWPHRILQFIGLHHGILSFHFSLD